MHLSVQTPAPVTALVDLESVKAKLGIEDDAQDELLRAYISATSSAITEKFGRELARQSYKLTWTGHSPGRFLLPCCPIEPTSLSVTLNGEAYTRFYLDDPEIGLCCLGSGCGSWVVTYTGGFLLRCSEVGRGLVSDWAASTAFPLRSFVRPVEGLSALRFECTTAGTSGASEPDWPSEAGETVTDGSVVWTARSAPELPEVFSQIAFLVVRDMEAGAGRPAGLAAVNAEGFSEAYSVTGSVSGTLSPEAINALEPLRARYGR